MAAIGVVSFRHAQKICGQMYTGWLLLSTSFFYFLGRALIRQWVYVGLCAVVECAWVSLICGFGLLAVEYNDASLLFWAVAGMLFSAVELCLCLYAFILLGDLRGVSGDHDV